MDRKGRVVAVRAALLRDHEKLAQEFDEAQLELQRALGKPGKGHQGRDRGPFTAKEFGNSLGQGGRVSYSIVQTCLIINLLISCSQFAASFQIPEADVETWNTYHRNSGLQKLLAHTTSTDFNL